MAILRPKLKLERGKTYVIDQSDATNATHPFKFTADSGTSEYTSGVTATGTPGQAGAKTTFVVPGNAPDNMMYYCTAHGIGMGQKIKIFGTAPVTYTGGEGVYGSSITHGQWRNPSDSTTSNPQIYIRQAVAGGQSQSAVAVNLRNALDNLQVGDTITVASPAKVFTISGGISTFYDTNTDYRVWLFDVDAQGLTNSTYFYEFTIPGLATYPITQDSIIQLSNINAKHTDAGWFQFNSNGTKLYLPEDYSSSYDEIHTYDLSSAYDITTTSNGSTYTNSNIINRPKGLFFNHNGTKVVVFEVSNDPSCKQYDLGTPYDISTISSNTPSGTISNSPSYIQWHSGVFANNGSKLYLMQSASNGKIVEFTCSTPGDISTATAVGSSNEIDLTATQGTASALAIAMNSTGTKLYVGSNPGGGNDPILYQHNLSTPFDLSTASLASPNVTIGASVHFAEFAWMNLINDTDLYILGLRTPSGQFGIWKYTV